MKDRTRVTPEGQALGRELSRLVPPSMRRLILEGEADTRCQRGAFVRGTIPNGCPQTQMDALTCVVEGVPFSCHVKRTADGEQELCHGWYAARVGLGGKRRKMPWPFSTEEDPDV